MLTCHLQNDGLRIHMAIAFNKVNIKCLVGVMLEVHTKLVNVLRKAVIVPLSTSNDSIWHTT